MASTEFELRVLTGIHAGAREALTGDSYVIGGDPACDFVLADPGVEPRHARLVRHDGGWAMEREAAEGAEPAPPIRMQGGSALALGPVIVAVEAPDAPWPPIEQLAVLQAEMDVPAAQPEAEPESETAPAADIAAAAAVPVATPPATQARRIPAVTWALAAFAVLSAAALVAWPMTHLSSGDAAQSVNPAVPPMSQRREIEKVLAAQGMGARAQIEEAGRGWRVRAAFLEEDEAEKLAAALSRLNPRPGLRVATELELREEVTEMLARLAQGDRNVLHAEHLGGTRFIIKGKLPSRSERAALLERLAASFPQVKSWGEGIVAAEDTADALLAQLRTEGWDVDGKWTAGSLDLQARVVPAQQKSWEQALVRALGRHAVPMHATLKFTPADPQAGPAPGARLPFEIRSVVGGETPYVVLAGGSKLMAGGSEQGWKLLAVEERSVTFENGTRRAVVSR